MSNYTKPPYELMDSADAWTLENTGRTLELGSRYLYDEAQRIEAGCPLSQSGLRLGAACRYIHVNYSEKGLEVPPDRRDAIMNALDLQGNLGFALWKVRSFRSEGYDFELRQLAQAGDGSGSSRRLLRSHGSLFHFAARLVLKSFTIEFCVPGDEEGPDFIASRDGIQFPCEVTTKDPAELRAESVEEFWRHVHNAVHRKKHKFRSTGYAEGVLLVDCSPIGHLIENAPLTTDSIVSMDGDGKESRIDRLIRYDGSPLTEGVKRLEILLRETKVTNVALRQCHFSPRDGVGEHLDQMLILGTMRGRRFWRYFDAPLIFPGPDVQIVRVD